jgi:hypothetical protein
LGLADVLLPPTGVRSSLRVARSSYVVFRIPGERSGLIAGDGLSALPQRCHPALAQLATSCGLDAVGVLRCDAFYYAPRLGWQPTREWPTFPPVEQRRLCVEGTPLWGMQMARDWAGARGASMDGAPPCHAVLAPLSSRVHVDVGLVLCAASVDGGDDGDEEEHAPRRPLVVSGDGWDNFPWLSNVEAGVVKFRVLLGAREASGVRELREFPPRVSGMENASSPAGLHVGRSRDDGPELWDRWREVEPSDSMPPWDGRDDVGEQWRPVGQGCDWRKLRRIGFPLIVEGDAALMRRGQTGEKASHLRTAVTFGCLPRSVRREVMGYFPLSLSRETEVDMAGALLPCLGALFFERAHARARHGCAPYSAVRCTHVYWGRRHPARFRK